MRRCCDLSLTGAALLAPALLAGCRASDDARGRTVTTDTAASGAIVVTNGERGIWDDASTWRLVEELRIASPDGTGPAAFNQVMALEVDATGRVYAAESRPPEIRVFTADGAYLRTIGRQGGGPGEFQEVAAMLWDSTGRLLVVDQRNARYARFDTTGRFEGSVPRIVSAFSMFPWPGRILDDGRMVDVGMKPGSTAFEHILIAARPGSPGRDTIALPSYDAQVFSHQSGTSRVQAAVPFAPSLIWVLDSRGYLWSAVTDRYRIVQRRLAGDTVRIIERAFQPVTVTASERDTAVARLVWFRRQGGQVDAARIPGVKPAFTSLMLDDRGYLWTTPSRSEGAEQTTYDVFDPDGRYLGPVVGSCGPWRPLIRGDRLYGVCYDEDGVPAVVRYRIANRPAL